MSDKMSVCFSDPMVRILIISLIIALFVSLCVTAKTSENKTYDEPTWEENWLKYMRGPYSQPWQEWAKLNGGTWGATPEWFLTAGQGWSIDPPGLYT